MLTCLPSSGRLLFCIIVLIPSKTTIKIQYK